MRRGPREWLAVGFPGKLNLPVLKLILYGCTKAAIVVA